jgi:anti-sigma B factor antagonist
MELEILEQSEALTRLALKGRLDTAGVDKVETRLNAALGRDKDGVVDLSSVTFLGSMGIRMLISAAKMLSRRGKRLVLIAPGPLVEQALKHTSLDDIIPVARDLDGARALLKS